KALSQQLSGLVDDNAAQIRPALAELDRVTNLLHRNQQNLDRSINSLAPFTRLFANVLGNGRWFDTYICGLLPPAVGPVNPEGCNPCPRRDSATRRSCGHWRSPAYSRSR